MTVREPAERVRRIVEAVRPHVDEVVIAVDEHGDPATARLCQGLADRVLQFESPGFGAALIGWATRQCSADWILRLDDDEIPSRALLEALPALTADREITHVRLERRWLFPDVRRYIAVHPWLPDPQTRLVRNLPGVWRGGGRVHQPHEVLGAGRITGAALYHADLVLRDLEQRRRKVERYEAARPGLRIADFPTNAMYLPEECAGVETAHVPAEDEPLIGALCAHAERSGDAREDADELVPLDEILAQTAAGAPGAEAHVGAVAFPRSDPMLPAGMNAQLEVDVTNLSPVSWPSDLVAGSPIRLGHRWYGRDGQPGPDGPRALLTAPVAPGATERLLMNVEVPQEPGSWTLEADLLHEEVRWFDRPARLAVSVVPPYWADDSRPRRGLPGLRRKRRIRARPGSFHGSFGLDGLDLRLIGQLGGRRAGVFVEAGANDGVSQSNTLLLEQAFGWTGLLVEPVPRLAALARRNRPGTPVEEVALVPFGRDGHRVPMVDVGLMSIVRGAMGGAAADEHHVRDGSVRGDVIPVELDVPGMPLSAVLDRHGLRHVDLLVLDVEGYEAPALAGLDFDRHVVEHMLVEARDRASVEKVLGRLYEPVAELSHHDVLYRRTAPPRPPAPL